MWTVSSTHSTQGEWHASVAAVACSRGCFHSHALQLRQAKLSFPAVQVLVGVFSDEVCAQNGVVTNVPHLERCEMLRHCRWVDEVVPDAPWKLDEAFVTAMRIDYVAIDEGVSIDPAYDKERVKGYDIIKGLRE